MPPRSSRRLLAPAPEKIAAEETHVVSKPYPDPNADAGLVRLPYELIIENYAPPQLAEYYHYYYDDIPDGKSYERTDVLTALSQTCKFLRDITVHRLWERLDACRVPERVRKLWFKYIMMALERKANGISTSPVRHYVRFSTRWANWTDLALVDLLVKRAPNLRTLELRSRNEWYLGTSGKWAQAVSKLALLKKLSVLILSFTSADENPGDIAVVTAARVLQNSAAVGEKRLVI
ncbi:hypothetical protein DFH09DRAFT_1304080 [Mycena vulgaris]|nr:hypothetical protein DFH09DRAFT_1304080 [Mycena vulgaris]